MSAPRFDAAWLMAQEFPPIRYVVPGIIPEGMTVLVAAPKIGKSWMVLGLACALANGGNAFERIPVGQPRPVLYLALEDGQRRLQSRLRSIGAAPSPLLEFEIAVPAGVSVPQVVGDYIKQHAHAAPVVILDTLGKVKPPTSSGNAYAEDYAAMGALKACVDAVPGSSLVIVHHTRKMDGSDFLDAVSGTQGIAGAADTVLLLKRDRGADSATLQVTSRDAAEGEYALALSPAGVWELAGADINEAAHAAQAAKAAEGTGDAMTAVLATLAKYPDGVTPGDLALDLGWEKKKANTYLARAAESGRASRAGRGLYMPVGTVGTVGNTSIGTPENYSSHTSNTVVGAHCPICGETSALANAPHGYVHPGCEVAA